MHFLKVEKEFLMLLKKATGFSDLSQDNVSDHSNLKMLSSKLMPQRLPIALAQEKAGNTSENLLNEIRQIIYSLYQAKEITKKVYNNKFNKVLK